jgi:hypothetical protein
MNYLEGTEFHGRWHYQKPAIAGGRGLGSREIALAVELAGDLLRIPVHHLEKLGLRVTTPQMAASVFDRRIQWLLDEKLIDRTQFLKARAAVANWAAGCEDGAPRVLSNTDFRFRNFIELSNSRTALIDWDDARSSSFELEHCIAYQWLLLWNRPDLQRILIRRARDALPIDRECLRTVLLMNAVTQAHVCRAKADLIQLHVAQASNFLNTSFFPEVWG